MLPSCRVCGVRDRADSSLSAALGYTRNMDNSDIGVFATARMRSNCGMIITSTLSRLSWGDVGVVALDALFCPVNEPPVRVAQR